MSDALGTLKENIVITPTATVRRPPWAVRAPAHEQGVGASQPLSGLRIRHRRPARERHKIVHFLHASGWTNKAIAESMGYSPNQVSIILRSDHPELLEVAAKAREAVFQNSTDVMLRFRQESMKSVETLVLVRDQAEDMGQRRLAARDILDRAGYSVVHKQVNVNADIPVEALNKVVEGLEAADEVASRRKEWAVQLPPEQKKAS